MDNQVTTKFPGSQDHLYLAGTRLWNLYDKYQPDFQNLNGMYTKDYGLTAIEAIKAAKALPNVAVRRATSKQVRALLSPVADNCLDVFLRLESCIEKAFPSIEWETQKQLAGSYNYNEAAKKVWSKVDAIMVSGLKYIQENTDKLINDGKGMPAGFEATFTKYKTEFESLLDSFGIAREGFTIQTTEKASANIEVYSSLIRMLDDGQLIYRRVPRMKKLFSYSRMLKEVSGPGKTGFTVSIADENKMKITNAVCFFIPGGAEFESNKRGAISAQLAAGMYHYTITAPGKNTITDTATAIAGKMTRIKITMTTAFAKEATV